MLYELQYECGAVRYSSYGPPHECMDLYPSYHGTLCRRVPLNFPCSICENICEAERPGEEVDWADDEDSQYGGGTFFPEDSIPIVSVSGQHIPKGRWDGFPEALKECLGFF